MSELLGRHHVDLAFHAVSSQQEEEGGQQLRWALERMGGEPSQLLVREDPGKDGGGGRGGLSLCVCVCVCGGDGVIIIQVVADDDRVLRDGR